MLLVSTDQVSIKVGMACWVVDKLTAWLHCSLAGMLDREHVACLGCLLCWRRIELEQLIGLEIIRLTYHWSCVLWLVGILMLRAWVVGALHKIYLSLEGVIEIDSLTIASPSVLVRGCSLTRPVASLAADIVILVGHKLVDHLSIVFSPLDHHMLFLWWLLVAIWNPVSLIRPHFLSYKAIFDDLINVLFLVILLLLFDVALLNHANRVWRLCVGQAGVYSNRSLLFWWFQCPSLVEIHVLEYVELCLRGVSLRRCSGPWVDLVSRVLYGRCVLRHIIVLSCLHHIIRIICHVNLKLSLLTLLDPLNLAICYRDLRLIWLVVLNQKFIFRLNLQISLDLGFGCELAEELSLIDWLDLLNEL